MKNTKSVIKVISLFIIISLFTSCEKDNLELLSGSVWDFENYTTTSENQDIQTWVALAKAILTDGTLTFSEDGTYELTSPVMDSQSISETGSWELVGSNQLIFTTGDGARTATIEELSKNKLVFLETYIYLDQTTYTTKSTYTK